MTEWKMELGVVALPDMSVLEHRCCDKQEVVAGGYSIGCCSPELGAGTTTINKFCWGSNCKVLVPFHPFLNKITCYYQFQMNRGRGIIGGNCRRGKDVPRSSATQNESPSPHPIIPKETGDTSNLANQETSTSHKILSPSTRASATRSQGVCPCVYIFNNKLFPESTSDQITKSFQKHLHPI